MHCTRSSSGCSGMQGIYAQLTVYWYSRHLCSIDWGVHLPSIYMHCTISSSGCISMQGIYAQLTGGSICLLYICIVLDLAVGVVVCKASMLNWLYTGIQGIYAQLTGGSRSTSGCISMQGFCAQLTGGSICLLYICIVLDLAVGVVVSKASMLNWLYTGIQGIYAQLTGGSRSTSGCISMQGIYAQLTGGSICLLYICIVLYLAVGVAVCKASMLNWLGGPSAFYIYVLY